MSDDEFEVLDRTGQRIATIKPKKGPDLVTTWLLLTAIAIAATVGFIVLPYFLFIVLLIKRWPEESTVLKLFFIASAIAVPYIFFFSGIGLFVGLAQDWHWLVVVVASETLLGAFGLILLILEKMRIPASPWVVRILFLGVLIGVWNLIANPAILHHYLPPQFFH